MIRHVNMDGQPTPGRDLIQQVAALRARLWDAQFRPVSVYNPDSLRTASPGKAPKGEDWTARNRINPPLDAVQPPHYDALNTGILCDGLRAIDIDIDNPTIAHSVKSEALTKWGECPIRIRSGSARCLLLYRAKEGQPPKRSISGTFGKVEILGRGQQFVAFGGHPSGSVLSWAPEAPGDISADDLPAITEEEITAYLLSVARTIGAKPETVRTDRSSPQSSRHGLRGDTLQVVAALSGIRNDGPADWETWNRIGMATWSATGGGAAGLAAFHAWSEQNAAYDPTETDRRWAHYATSPPSAIGAGTLFRMARQEAPTESPPQDGGPAGPERLDEERSASGASAVPPNPPLPVLYFDDIKVNDAAADFVEGLLITASMGIVYGQSNSGKTFWTSDLALHVAAGKTWNGRQVECGSVLWLAMEGSMGIQNRVAAWRDHHGIDSTIPFAIVPVSLNLLDPDADTTPLIETIRVVSKHLEMDVVLTVVDTLSRAMAGGNENAPDDMGALVTNGTRIQQETRSALLWIHHSGKDEAKGARGHSLLRAATDTEIEITAEGTQRLARVTKQREMDCAGEFAFSLKVVELGQNRHGKPVTSCVVEGPTCHTGTTSGEALSTPVHGQRLKGHLNRAVEVLGNLLASAGESGFAGVPKGVPSVPDKWWRDRFYEAAMAGAEMEAKRKAFRRTADELVLRHIVGMAGGRVWLVRHAPVQHEGDTPQD